MSNDGTAKWRPLTVEVVQQIILKDLAACDAEQKAGFHPIVSNLIPHRSVAMVTSKRWLSWRGEEMKSCTGRMLKGASTRRQLMMRDNCRTLVQSGQIGYGAQPLDWRQLRPFHVSSLPYHRLYGQNRARGAAGQGTGADISEWPINRPVPHEIKANWPKTLRERPRQSAVSASDRRECPVRESPFPGYVLPDRLSSRSAATAPEPDSLNPSPA